MDGVELSFMDYWLGFINGCGRKGDNVVFFIVFNVIWGKKYWFYIVMVLGEFVYWVLIDRYELMVIESDGYLVEFVIFEFVMVFFGEMYVVEIEVR